MELTINEAREELLTITKQFEWLLTDSQQTALSMADSALKTIDDMNTKGR